MPVNRRALAGAIAARLATVTNATGFYGQIGRGLDGTLGGDPQPKSADDLRVQPYFVLYPGAGSDGPDSSLGDRAADVTLDPLVTVAAGDVDDLLAAVDRIDAALSLWTPVVEGHVCGRLRPPPGYSAPQLVDRDFEPVRLYVPLRYQFTATT